MNVPLWMLFLQQYDPPPDINGKKWGPSLHQKHSLKDFEDWIQEKPGQTVDDFLGQYSPGPDLNGKPWGAEDYEVNSLKAFEEWLRENGGIN